MSKCYENLTNAQNRPIWNKKLPKIRQKVPKISTKASNPFKKGTKPYKWQNLINDTNGTSKNLTNASKPIFLQFFPIPISLIRFSHQFSSQTP